MAFIRIKKIKGKEYAYLIKNKWTKKGPRQKASKYLGPVIKLDENLDNSSEKKIEIEENENLANYLEKKYNLELEKIFEEKKINELLKEIIFFELKKKSFIEYFGKKGTKKDSLIFENCIVDLNNLKIYLLDTEIPCVLFLNSDFMCEYTLKKIYNFLEYGNEMDIAKKLAKTFISAGIPLENEIFISLFKKTFKDGRLKF